MRWEPLERFEQRNDEVSHFQWVTCSEDVPWEDSMKTGDVSWEAAALSQVKRMEASVNMEAEGM